MNRSLLSIVKCFSLVATLLAFTGCASIVHNGNRSVTINSNPTGAKVEITKADTLQAVHSGVTPLTVSLDPKRGFFKGQDFLVRITLDGYQSTELQVNHKMSGWYWGNLVFGGLLGMLVVDPATGAMWNLSPEHIDAELSKTVAGIVPEKGGFCVILLKDATPAMRAQMQRIN